MSNSAVAVRRRAREVLAESGVSGPPVDVEALIAARGLSLQEVPEIRPGVFGAFFIDGVDAGVMISAACYTSGHRRFTLGHELGHFVLDGHVEELLPAGMSLAISQGGNFRDQKSEVEREADIFASELLMPTDRLAGVTQAVPCLDSVRKLANSCDVSISSAAIRLLDLVGEPAAVILSHDRAVEWVAASASLREHTWARQPLKGEWVPKGSATRRLLDNAAVSTRELEERQSLLLCEWFDGAPPMCRVEEECLSMASYGRLLTLLRPVDLPSADEEEEDRQRALDRQRQMDWRDSVRSWNWD